MSQVVVVGAGFSGLAAAHELAGRGFEVTTVEARERVGGRVWSHELPNGAVVELGAEWIGPGDTTVKAMADHLDLPLVGVGVDFMLRDVVGGPGVPYEEQEATVQLAAALLADLDESTIARDTMGAFIDELPVNDARRDVFRSRLQGSFGSDLHDISLRMMVERASPLRVTDDGAHRDDRYLRFVDGNQSLAKAMAGRLGDLRLGHAVRTITQGDDGSAVTGRVGAESFEIIADAIVVAVPVALAAELDFDPPLPTTVASAISALRMGTAAKLAVGTAEPPPLRAIQDVAMPYWCWTGRGGDGEVRPAVTAFCGSVEARRNLATDSGDATTWLEQMRSTNPDLDFVGDPILVDWSRDEWARGCYSAFDNRASDLIPALAEPVGRLFFAGEHTADQSATMEGALASGLAAAEQVEARLPAR